MSNVINDTDLARSVLHDLPGGEDALDRIAHLEHSWSSRQNSKTTAATVDTGSPGLRAWKHGSRAELDVDVILAGGGLWLILAPLLARRGLRVAVLDRGVIGQGHREWNISARELHPFVESGLFTQEEINDLVLARYDYGVCRWYEGGTYPVTGVLDHAVDGVAFLAALRSRAETAGVCLLDRHTFEGFASAPHGVLVQARDTTGAAVTLTARVLIDALGAASPHARVDLACPTVGGVLGDLATGDGPKEVNSRVGDILVSIDHRENGRQHIWEGFPGAAGDLTTYLFYYARASALPPQPLLSLYGRFFRTRPHYKQGTGVMRRLTYGIIPGWSRLQAPPMAPHDGVVLVGDAAARHSPLTFCGFGSMARSFLPITQGLLDAFSDHDFRAIRLAQLAPEPPVLGGVGALAFFLTEPRWIRDGAETNRLLDAAFQTLYQMGPSSYGALLRDEMTSRSFAAFLLRTSWRRPEAYTNLLAYLDSAELVRWAGRVGRGVLRPSTMTAPG